MSRGNLQDGEAFVMVALAVAVFLLLAFYWRTPESGGGQAICERDPRPPCVVVTWPWAD